MAADVLARYGRVDVLVNNAGRTQVGAFEETTDGELRDLFELHAFGPARLPRALLPRMREQDSGSIVNISSFGGQLSFAGFSGYSATKAALERLSEGLADEVDPFGIKVLIVVPGAFRINLFGRGTAYFSEEHPAYEEKAGATRKRVREGDAAQPGDPAKVATAIGLGITSSPRRSPARTSRGRRTSHDPEGETEEPSMAADTSPAHAGRAMTPTRRAATVSRAPSHGSPRTDSAPSRPNMPLPQRY
ncbi:SDR family NAD(P)-dependent oxidoreductase [Streptomyces sp. NPDC004838]